MVMENASFGAERRQFYFYNYGQKSYLFNPMVADKANMQIRKLNQGLGLYSVKHQIMNNQD